MIYVLIFGSIAIFYGRRVLYLAGLTVYLVRYSFFLYNVKQSVEEIRE
jgi:hypothetical protein